jgi:hypothetical protein
MLIMPHAFGNEPWGYFGCAVGPVTTRLIKHSTPQSMTARGSMIIKPEVTRKNVSSKPAMLLFQEK